MARQSNNRSEQRSATATRQPRLIRVVARGLVGTLVAGSALAFAAVTETPVQAAPGSPGVPGNPAIIFAEDFENAPGQGLSIRDYVSASGQDYTASDFWSSRAECNGFVTSRSTPTNTTDCTVSDLGSTSRRLSFQNTVRQMVGAIATLNGGDPLTNSGLAELANSRAPSGEVVFQTVAPIPLASANRFVSFSVNAAATTCARAQANLEFFAVVQSGSEIPLNTTPLNPCTQGTVIGATTAINTGPIYGATLFSQRSILLEGSTLGVVLRNVTNSVDGNGNDYAIDDIRILDVTPQLDKSFTPGVVRAGETSILTLTVTNTSELAEKDGWAFVDTLPDGLTVASPQNVGGTCEAVVDAPAGSATVTISDGVLEAGEASCTITIEVASDLLTSAAPQEMTYANCAANISGQVGIDDPDCAEVTFFTERELEITKSSDATPETRVGDTVTYTVTATNVGNAGYTSADPAVILDDLSGVLDDALYNGDATADRPGSLSYDPPVLSWSGALGAGESVTLTYSITVGGTGGDGTVRNVAWVPADPGNPETPSCDLNGGGTTDPATGEPCIVTAFALPKLAISKVADTVELPGVGESVTYTIEVTNLGPGDYTVANPATFVDDLSDVLDDATFDGTATASVGSTSYLAPLLSWEGVLEAGDTATIEYTVLYTGAGDRSLINVACVPVAETVAGANPCDRVTVPGARLTQWKSVESSDTPAVAGSVLTYTLHFSNDGSAPAAVDSVDLLTHVLDDADVTVEPVASVGLTATRTGDSIAVTGTVAPGATATVTYEVTLKADGARGDDIASNFLLANDPGNPPVVPTTPACTPLNADLPTCTSTPIAAVTYAKAVSASTDPIGTGTVLTYVITIRSTGTATTPVSRDDVLADVLDDATLTQAPASDFSTVTVSPVVDDRFHIGGVLAAGATARVSYQVTVDDASDRGNNSADNYLVPEGGTPPTECPEASTDCTVTPLPAISVTKSADPATGTAVTAGDQVTYTLEFVNTGSVEGAADYTDDLSGVLDDADLTAGPTSDAATLDATIDDLALHVVGTVPAGETITVSYTVTVKPDAAQGDRTLRNVVVVTGEDPVCVVGSGRCTEHPVTPTPSALGGDMALTGSMISPWLIGMLALLPIGAGLVIGARVRRSRTS